MANFSGGSGILPWIYFIDLFALIPYFCIITFFTVFRNGDYKDGYEKKLLIKRLNKVILPVMLLLTLAWSILLIISNSLYTDILDGAFLYLLCGFMPMVIVYCSLRSVIKIKKVVKKRSLYLQGLLFLLLGMAISYPIYLWVELIARS
jgi:uncharacterized membrane protein YwzB